MKKHRVFLVDDHPLIREVLARKLVDRADIEIVGEFGGAEDALAQMKRLSPDVVVMDISLPGMDGVEATRQIKTTHPATKVIILSAYGVEFLTPSIRAGADGFLLKTSPMDELIGGMVKVIQGEALVDPSLTRHLMEQVSAAALNNPPLGLSPRQRALLKMVAEGRSSRDMASLLFISEATLKREFRHIFDAFGVNDRAHAVAEAYRRKLI
ncbi:MAG: response regulator transcription factor [Chloroflexi bacterium]|nr:response regulator transcription factor [Chloroflexota bacterium]MCH8088571.1 response regulator transcription factor [Chloroflexota bacterium]